MHLLFVSSFSGSVADPGCWQGQCLPPILNGPWGGGGEPSSWTVAVPVSELPQGVEQQDLGFKSHNNDETLKDFQSAEDMRDIFSIPHPESNINYLFKQTETDVSFNLILQFIHPCQLSKY